MSCHHLEGFAGGEKPPQYTLLKISSPYLATRTSFHNERPSLIRRKRHLAKRLKFDTLNLCSLDDK